ncbi:T9SS type A sorting domain-containing protein [Hymenobacter sp. ASUV-10]|uniref:T9SS type A sorting domain-containing protein n=1 Tax=Hymenobacter aranciens TaxID=3063996 RepID=A0ABT9BH88_9BACT|nr:T9SS type A sorting domain-containing protein [Hymenobacter sp. ASUV-10]MDO7877606.1 T9SS type A sorting domain-containing protein [Hymenobacter sp. ASUV-10]
MKRLFTLLGVVLSLGVARLGYAQSYAAPETVQGYAPGLVAPWPVLGLPSGRYPAGWTVIQPLGAAVVWSPVTALAFPFQFFGQAVSSFKVSTRGVLTFTTTATTMPGATATALPAAQVPDMSVCIWPQQAVNNIATATFGQAPHRQQWVSFSVGWCVVLEETSNSVYVVGTTNNEYSSLSWTVGVQRDASLAVQVAGSPQITGAGYGYNSALSQLNPFYHNTFYYAFRPTPAPAAALALVNHSLLPLADGRYPVAVGGVLRNVGSQLLGSYELGYRVGNGPAVTATVQPAAALPGGDTLHFRHPLPWQPARRGTYRLKVWATAPGDPHPLDDTLLAVVRVADSTMQRTVLLESFGSSTCAPCGPGNTNVRAVNRAVPGRYLEAHYQQNRPSPGDPYNTPEATNRAERYYSYTGGIPATVIDGGRIVNSIEYRRSDFDRAAQLPSPVRIRAAYRVVGNTVQAVAQVQALDSLGADYELYLAITERSTRNNQRFNERVFYHVFRKALPSSPLALPRLTSGQQATFSQSYTFPAGNTIESFDSLQVVAVVQHRTRRDVLQAAQAVLNGPLLGRQAPQAAGLAFDVLPNPAAGRSELQLRLPRAETVRVEVLDALGRCVVCPAPVALGAGPVVLPLDLRGLTPGLYLVRLNSAAGVSGRRLQVE